MYHLEYSSLMLARRSLSRKRNLERPATWVTVCGDSLHRAHG